MTAGDLWSRSFQSPELLDLLLETGNRLVNGVVGVRRGVGLEVSISFNGRHVVSPAKELQEHELACLSRHELVRRTPAEPLVRFPQEVLRIIVKICNEGADLVGHLGHALNYSIRENCGQFAWTPRL